VYEVTLSKDATKYLRRLPKDQADRVREKLHALAVNPDSAELDVKRLVGMSGYRLRVGKWRVIFERHEQRLWILVVTIDARGGVYK
jgi:mRNA interferase RelE/StbE